MDQGIVKIELSPVGRMNLGQQIRLRAFELGFDSYGKMGLGFELPANWPEDKSSEITLAQLTVLAVKLKMNIIISDNGIDLVSMNGE